MNLKEKFISWLVWSLPRSIVYWATIRLFAHASRILSDRVVTGITIDEALTAWMQQ